MEAPRRRRRKRGKHAVWHNRHEKHKARRPGHTTAEAKTEKKKRNGGKLQGTGTARETKGKQHGRKEAAGEGNTNDAKRGDGVRRPTTLARSLSV